MATSESTDVYGVSAPKDGVCTEDAWVTRSYAGRLFILAVLRSDASGAQKVAALQTAGIRTAKALHLLDQGLTGDEVKVLAMAMNCNDVLTDMTLSDNPMGDSGVGAVVRMAATTPSLKTLSLQGCGMTATGAKLMASWLAGNPPLQELSIGGNATIGDDGLTALAEGLKSNSNLVFMIVANCGMTVRSAAAWADLLRSTALRRVYFGGDTIGDDAVTMLADAAQAHRQLIVLDIGWTKLTDRGMSAVADMVAHHPSLEKLYVRGFVDVTDAGWAALSLGVRCNPNIALTELWGNSLAKYDDTLPDYVVEDNEFDNEVVLSYYRAQARIRRRVAAVAVLRTAWRRSHGRPVCDAAGDKDKPTRAAELAHMVQLRRMCRVREGKDEVVEPFGRCVVAYL